MSQRARSRSVRNGSTRRRLRQRENLSNLPPACEIEWIERERERERESGSQLAANSLQPSTARQSKYELLSSRSSRSSASSVGLQIEAGSKSHWWAGGRLDVEGREGRYLFHYAALASREQQGGRGRLQMKYHFVELETIHAKNPNGCAVRPGCTSSCGNGLIDRFSRCFVAI